MSTPAAQVRVRLSADGVKDVVNALKSVERQAQQTAAGKGLGAINGALRELKGLLPAIGLGAAVVGFTSLVKNALKTADAIDDLSQKVGASAENLSVLQYQASISGGTDMLEGSLTRLAVRLGDLEQGSRQAVDAFGRLGLTTKDFAGLDTVQAFDLIAQRLGKVEDSTRKTDIAVQIFGKTGAQLMPLLNDLAATGFGNVEEAARRLGLVVTGDMAAMAAQANDSFALIKAQAQGLALQFVAGFAPAIAAAMGDFRESTAGDGVDAANEFGKGVGDALNWIIKATQITGAAVGRFVAEIRDEISTTMQMWGRLARADISGAKELDKAFQGRRESRAAALDQTFAEIDRRAAERAETASKLAAAAAERAKKLRDALRGRGDDDADQAAATASRRAAEVKRAAAEAEKIRADQARADEAAGEARFDLEQRILELTGRGSEAKIRALDAELAKQREILALATGGVTQEDDAKFGQVRQKTVAGIDLEKSLEEGRAALDELARIRTRIEQDVQLGIRSQWQGEQDILAVEKERLAVLQAIAGQATGAAQAVGSAAAIADAAALNEQVRQVEVTVANASDSLLRLKEGAQEALHDGLTDVLANLQDYDSVGDIFTSLASTVASALQQIAAEMLATYIQAQLLKAAMSIFGGGGARAAAGASGSAASAASFVGPRKDGGLVGYAGGGSLVDARGGGQIRGPGTARSDSIPAITTTGKRLLLSNTEFIVQGKAVQKPGMLELLRDINSGKFNPYSPPRGMPRRFAEGGSLSEPASMPAKAGSTSRLTGVLGLEPGLVMKQLDTEDFDRFLVKRLQRNSGSIRNILR